MAEGSLVILGAGGHACVVAEAAALSGWNIEGHLAPDASDDPLLGNWLGNDDALEGLMGQGMQCAIGLGFVNRATAASRAKLLAALDVKWLATVVHPGASIAPSANLEPGCFVAANATVGTRAQIGLGALINTGAVVEHHNTTGPNTHVATGARLAGGVTLGRDVLVGAGSIVLQGTKVGDGAIVGAGSVVLADLPAHTTCVGNPGRVL